MEAETTCCAKCGVEIPLNTFYYAIVKNLEFFYKDEDTGEIKIEIEEDYEIITLCKSCGSYFNTDNLEKILKIIPPPGQEGKN